MNAGLTNMRQNPRSCSAYMAPMEAPTIRSGFSFAQSSRSICIVSCGSTGRSGAIICAFGNNVPIAFTVPFCPLEANPCKYNIFFPDIKSGLAYSKSSILLLIIKFLNVSSIFLEKVGENAGGGEEGTEQKH